jgi:TonB-linked SusC/RagA family outer membrane protein
VGASVFIEGMNIGTTTNDAGRYTITVPPARAQGQRVTLTARALGHRAQQATVSLSGAITQHFSLPANPLRLGEVIVTGAGTTSTVEKLGNTVNTVSAADIVRANESNVVNALAAKAPNVQVVSQSGDPGSSASIRIRGSKTITGTGQPLFVVDGTPIDNSTNATGSSIAAGTVAPNRASDINPDDIESVTILKGAASAAIYGARAGQGVVLITTKRGKSGETRYQLRSGLTVDNVVTKYPLQSKYGQGFAWNSTKCATPNCSTGTGNAVSFGPAITGATFDHFGELFEKGTQFDNALSVSGGNDRTQFYISGSAYDNRGIVVGPNDSYDRYTARLNASHQLVDALKVSGNVSYIDTRGNFIQKGSNTSGLLLGGLRTPPDFDNNPYLDPATGLQRSFRFPNPTLSSVVTPRGYDNPLFVIYRQQNTGNSNRAFGNAQLDYTPLGWLSVKYTLGADAAGETRVQSIPTGQVLSYQFNNTQIDHNLIATGTYTATNWLGGTVVLGQNINERRFQQLFVQGNTLLGDQPFKLTNTLERTVPNDAETRVHTEGYFGQATFDLFDQLYVTAGLRNDGSSTFSDNSRRNWFPKASAAWTFTKHLPTIGLDRVLSFGKLRTAYGEVGQEPGAYQLLSVLVGGGTFADGGWTTQVNATQNNVGALNASTIKGQPEIKPERTAEFEAGMDLGLFGDRADFSATYYNARSRDVIFQTPIPASTGYTSQVKNAGTIRNRGVELTLNTRILQRQDLGWELGLQWARNDNLVLDLVGAEYVAQGGSFAGAFGAATKGGRVGGLRGNDWARCGVADVAPGSGVTVAQVQAACAGAPTGALYINTDGFPVIDNTERQISDPQPNWTGGISNTLTYKKVRVSSLFDIKKGGQVWNGTKGALYFFGTHRDTEGAREGQHVYGGDYMTQPTVGPGSGKAVYLVCPAGSTAATCNTPAGSNWFAGDGGGFGSVSSQFIEDGSYVKLREISLSYTFDQPQISRVLNVSSVDVKIAGRNLKTWTKYSGFDPETNLAGAEVPITGVDFFNNPQTKSFVFMVTVNR